jgi:hypothetical protein
MAEFTIESTPIEDTQSGEVIKNIKELKIGNGRWKVDNEALRLYDDSGNCIIYLGE